MAAKYAYISVPPGQVEFIFDQNPGREYNASMMYDYMRKLKEWQFCENLDPKLGFSSQKGSVGIQTSDLFARESMKYVDSQIGPIRRRMRGSLNALRETKRFRIGVMDRQQIMLLETRCKQLGESLKGGKMSDYYRWLEHIGCTDSTSARIRYFSEIDRLNQS